MSVNRQACFDFVMNQLEGAELSNDPNPTKYGIEQEEYDNYRKTVGLPSQTIANITPKEVNILYSFNYWFSLKCNIFLWPLNFVVFEFGLNLPDVCAKSLQTLVNVEPDGNIGTETVEAVLKQDPTQLAQHLLDKQRDHYTNNAHDQSILKGLLSRCSLTATFTGLV